MKSLLLTLAVLVNMAYSTCLQAQEQFKILFLNESPIEIGGKSCQVNDTINSADNIVWKSQKQVMKILNLTNQRQSILALDVSIKENIEQFHRILLRTKGSLQETVKLYCCLS